MTACYAAAQLVDQLGISPEAYDRMHRWDRLHWRHYLLLKGHYTNETIERQRKKAAKDFKHNLPKTVPRGGRK